MSGAGGVEIGCWAEPITSWLKSSRSNPDNYCVEAARFPSGIGVRDSKLGDASPVLGVSRDQWSAVLVGVRSGEFG
jgi:hypothetical protein